jgi:hypothetical protein
MACLNIKLYSDVLASTSVVILVPLFGYWKLTYSVILNDSILCTHICKDQLHCSNFNGGYINKRGTQWRSWLRHCVTSWKVAGSILDGVIGIFY